MSLTPADIIATPPALRPIVVRFDIVRGIVWWQYRRVQ